MRRLLTPRKMLISISIVEAHLDLFATACGGYLPFSAQNVAIYTVDDDSWTESTVTWANAPAKGSFMLSIDGGVATVDTYNQWTDGSNGALAQFLEAQNLSSGGDGEASFWLEISGASANTQLSFVDKDGALGACGAAGAKPTPTPENIYLPLIESSSE